ncbi:hypothetical protein WH47_05953 [Habropoda laboriosa]|uniref:Uncharacterized protein n=2 Tax=Habropoda laboriosa TaxID=597456 RepID=A0A0L7REN3_9HYME|nr:hypothetical protein WH47_05953 [Habropoda laboriosa]
MEKKEESTTEFLKDAMKTLAELRETVSVRGVKRSLEDCQEDMARRKVKCNTDRTRSVVGNVPPVKLRRSPKRFTSIESEIGELRNVRELLEKSCEEETIVEEKTEESITKSSVTDSVNRLDNSESIGSSNTIRKNEVEIRLCDSSTDEDQTTLEKHDERKLVGTYTIEDTKETAASCDSLLNMNEEDYLTLDMASDDILKDIDALLKEKSSV